MKNIVTINGESELGNRTQDSRIEGAHEIRLKRPNGK